MILDEYRKDLVNSYKADAQADAISDREAFFNYYAERLADSEIIEDFEYLPFDGVGSRNRTIHIDGYDYNDLDQKLTLFTIPPLEYFDEKRLTMTEATQYFNRAKYFYLDADRIVSSSEESSEGYGLAFDILNNKMEISRVEIIILTDYIKSPAINTIAADVERDVRFEYNIFDITRVKNIDESQEGKEALEIDIQQKFNVPGIPALQASVTDNYVAYLVNIPGTMLAKLYDEYQSRLLEGNVRSFLQTKGKVNKGIRSTILNDPEMFFAYNNGIAATASAVEVKNTSEGTVITKFVGLQIVNGGQTTASLASAWSNDTRYDSREKIEKIYVPMKVSVVSDENAQDLVPNISRFANSQNKVSDADLASNHPFHIKIEEMSRRILAPAIGGAQFGTYWYYERANGQYRQQTYKATASVKKRFEAQNPKNQMFKKVDLAKYINIYHQKPQIASAGTAKSFKVFSDWMIKEWDKSAAFVNDEFYKKVIALAILFKQTDRIVKEQPWYQSYKANIVAYTISAIVHRIEVEYPNRSLDLMTIWKNQDISYGVKLQIAKTSEVMYHHLIDENRTVENVTEWAKRDISWNRAKDIQFELEDEFLATLEDADRVKTDEYSAKKEEQRNNDLDALVQVFNYGEDFWREVQSYGNREGVLNMKDSSFINLMIGAFLGGRQPTDSQAKAILRVLEKVRSEGFSK